MSELDPYQLAERATRSLGRAAQVNNHEHHRSHMMDCIGETIALLVAMKEELLAAAMERVGFAIWQVQALEDTVANYIVVRVRGEKGMGREKARGLLEAAQKQTFGALVRDLQRTGILEPDLATRLSDAVEERNWFAHRGRRETRGMLVNKELYRALIARADKLATESLALNKLLGDRLVAFAKDSGVDGAKLEREAKKLARAWGLRE